MYEATENNLALLVWNRVKAMRWPDSL